LTFSGRIPGFLLLQKILGRVSYYSGMKLLNKRATLFCIAPWYPVLLYLCIPIKLIAQTGAESLPLIPAIDAPIHSAEQNRTDSAETPSSETCTAHVKNSTKIALVLSGGGARGLAQIGVLKALEEEGIQPDLIVATSMGAIIGSMYAIGIAPDSIERMSRDIDWDLIFTNTSHRRDLLVSQKNEPTNYLFELRFADDLTPILPNSISHGQLIHSILSPLLSAPLYQAHLDFDRLTIPLRVVTTNIVTGQTVVFSKGNLADAIRASSGIPLAFSPVAIDSMLLLDGGLTANIPVEAAVKENADYIIAVDVTSPMWTKGDLTNPLHLFDQVVAIGIDKQKKHQKELADVVITPELEGFTNTDFSSPDTLISRGYREAKKRIADIKKDLAGFPRTVSLSVQQDTISGQEIIALPLTVKAKGGFSEADFDTIIRELQETNFGRLSEDSLHSFLVSFLNKRGLPFAKTEITEKSRAGTCIEIEPGRIKNISIEGNRNTLPRLIQTTSGLREGQVLHPEDIQNAIELLYATNLFNTVTMYVDSLLSVHVKVMEKEYWRSRFGLRFDEYHLVEGYIEPAYENLLGTALCLSAHLQYGKKREKYALELTAHQPWSVHWANNICLQSYISRERIINIDKSSDTLITLLDTIPDTTFDTTYYTKIRYNETGLMKTGILFRIGGQLGRSAMIDAIIRLERFRLEQTDVGIIDALGPSFRNGIAFLKLRLMIDNLDRLPFPQKGQKHYISIGGASEIISGTENFITMHSQLQFYFTLRKKHTFSPLLMFCWADQNLPPVEKLWVGGSLPDEKYRDLGLYYYVPFIGLKPRAMSGDIVFLLHSLYRLAITKKFFLSVMADWGYAWNRNPVSETSKFNFDMATAKYFIEHAPVGVGAGLSLQTPVGPLSLSFGRVVHGASKDDKDDFDIREENTVYFSAGYDF